ncbi:MAG: (Fe-S)-binding protein [Deltaproteobacteria bacterium]|nr:(Fe-S)-binding protein [Deltaproteobacteria bacterium]
MQTTIISPANASFLGIPTVIFSILIPLIGLLVFTYIMAMRRVPLVNAAPDSRFDHASERFFNVLKIWLGQYRQPRYMVAGIVHIVIFFGFLILSIRATSLVIIGFSEDFALPGFSGTFGHLYNILKDYAATAVLIGCGIAAYRRAVVKPARYAVPAKYGKDHTAEALFVLALISILMISESCFDASLIAANLQQGLEGEYVAPLTLSWLFKSIFMAVPVAALQVMHVLSFYIHDLTFFFFLCFLPLGKHFHVITSIFNVYFMRLKRGNIKPVKYGVKDEDLDDLELFGVKKLEDFTWKHLLDFYSCADCGRCSDNCPANTVGRPLSPRFISIKGRDLIFKSYPILPVKKPAGPGKESEDLIGSIYNEDEIWSCTTCGACEQECPIGIEYIDKIVDLRRGMVDDGNVPQSLQKPLRALEKRGNPYGKMEKKRAAWIKDKEFAAECEVKVLEKGGTASTLYFVDSITSYDDRMMEIARSTAKLLDAMNLDFGVLGKTEKDSGNEVRRFGEEMLFQALREENSAAIEESGASEIVTADPHAYNCLKNEYNDLPPVSHISQTLLAKINSNELKLKPVTDSSKIYTYHDPCYLGRHNDLYDAPRDVLDSIQGLTRVEMEKNRDRAFCCGGGGLMLFYEPEEDQRMGVLRVEMAKEAGANVIVTACPFCLVNMEDAIKVAGLEGEMEAIDLAELVELHLA